MSRQEANRLYFISACVVVVTFILFILLTKDRFDAQAQIKKENYEKIPVEFYNGSDVTKGNNESVFINFNLSAA